MSSRKDFENGQKRSVSKGRQRTAGWGVLKKSTALFVVENVWNFFKKNETLKRTTKTTTKSTTVDFLIPPQPAAVRRLPFETLFFCLPFSKSFLEDIKKMTMMMMIKRFGN